MRVKEMRDLSNEEIVTKISDTRREIVDMRFQLACRKLESPAKLRQARRRLAQLLTVQCQKSTK